MIPNGVDTSLFNPNLNAVKDVHILFCGRIEHRKGSRAMVDVCKALIKKKNDIKILIVGYGDDDVWVNSQLSIYAKNIIFTGKVGFSQMHNYYSRSKIYISTSYYEGLPGTCLEAMAMGLPVIVWDFLFYRDLVEHAKTGYLVEPNNVNEMAKLAVEVLGDEQARLLLTHYVRKHAEIDYNWANLATKILKVFD